MTSSDFSGRNLDVAVARAMEHAVDDGLADGTIYPALLYSTDPATLGEMKVWIRSMGHVVQAVHWLDGSVTLKLLPDDVTGGTDNEAWARLVVAVKENTDG